MRIVLTAIILSLLIATAGCGLQDSLKKPLPDNQIGQTEKQIHVDPDLADKVKETARSVKGVKDSTAVVINREISAGIKVGGFDRLRLKQIKKEVREKIEGLNRGYQIYVTSDKKLFAQLQQMEHQAKGAQGKALVDLQKQVNKLNQDMKD